MAGGGRTEVIEASCHCGAVRLAIDAAPETVTDCNCSILPPLRRAVGLLLPETGRDHAPDRSDRHLHVGTTAPSSSPLQDLRLRYPLVAGRQGARSHGVNARLMEPEILTKAKVRHLDGAVTWEYLD